MEKAPGVELAHIWSNLSGDQRCKIVKQIVQFEKKLMTLEFPGIGSLYYSESLDENARLLMPKGEQPGTVPGAEAFVIGPTTDQRFFEEGRGQIVCDRGPCSYTF